MKKNTTLTEEHYGRRVIAENHFVSNDTRITGCNNNDLIIGTSGCGKTGGYVIPNLQQLTGSMIVADTKGQLQRRFRNDFIQRGYEVHTIDFVNPEKSDGYNPLDYIRRDSKGHVNEQDILRMSRLLVPMLDDKEPIWEQSAAAIVAFAIGYVMDAYPEKKRNLIEVANVCRDITFDIKDEEIVGWVCDHEDTFAAKKYTEMSTNHSAEKMFASIAGFVSVAMEHFSYRESAYIFAKKRNVQINDVGRQKTVLFLNVSDMDSSYDRMVNLFYDQALQVLCRQADANPEGRLDVPVRIIMDDFAASAKLPEFDRIISVIRSRDISVSIILQSISQLNSMYNEAEATTITNNCDTVLYLGGQDYRTAEFVSKRACKTVESVLLKPRNKVYVMISGEKAVLENKIAPYSSVSDYGA